MIIFDFSTPVLGKAKHGISPFLGEFPKLSSGRIRGPAGLIWACLTSLRSTNHPGPGRGAAGAYFLTNNEIWGSICVKCALFDFGSLGPPRGRIRAPPGHTWAGFVPLRTLSHQKPGGGGAGCTSAREMRFWGPDWSGMCGFSDFGHRPGHRQFLYLKGNISFHSHPPAPGRALRPSSMSVLRTWPMPHAGASVRPVRCW